MRWLLLFGIVSPLVAQEGMGCIKDMMVPAYTSIARRSRQGGDVRAIVTIGKEGQPSKIETVAKDPDLAEEVRDFLTHETTYQPACSTKKLEVIFTFRLEGKPEATPPVFVRFQYPNHFVIITRPRATDF
jgi:hypothetical protein